MKSPKQQQGFTLVAVIFLVIVLGGALAIMATLSSQSTGQFTQNLLQSRARFAAQAGLEWGTQQLVTVTPEHRIELCIPGVDVIDSTNDFMDDVEVDVPAYPDITVRLICVQRQYSNNSNILLYDLTARAEYGQLGATDYVWTEQNATLEFN